MAIRDTARTRAKQLWGGMTQAQRRTRFGGTRTEELLGKDQDAAAIAERDAYEKSEEGFKRGGSFGTLVQDVRRRR